MLSKEDWIILRLMREMMRSESAGKFALRPDVRNTTNYLLAKYTSKQFNHALRALEKEA